MNPEITIAGRNYILHIDGKESDMAYIYRITGKRTAEGALAVSKMRGYEGIPMVIGISALERCSWWEIAEAIAHIIPNVRQPKPVVIG